MGSVVGWLTWVFGLILAYLFLEDILKLRSISLKGAVSFLLTPVFGCMFLLSGVLKSQLVDFEYNLGDAYIGIYLGIFFMFISGLFWIVYILESLTNNFKNNQPQTQAELSVKAVKFTPYGSKINLRSWRIYFWMLVVAQPISLIMDPSMVTIAELVLTIIVLAGFWGYLHSKPLIRRGFWKSIFCVNVIYLLTVTIWLTFTTLSKQLSGNTEQILILLITVFSIPQLLALWRYGYCCHHIWEPISTITNTSDITSVTNSGK